MFSFQAVTLKVIDTFDVSNAFKKFEPDEKVAERCTVI